MGGGEIVFGIKVIVCEPLAPSVTLMCLFRILIMMQLQKNE